jgi:hypothetical protein
MSDTPQEKLVAIAAISTSKIHHPHFQPSQHHNIVFYAD